MASDYLFWAVAGLAVLGLGLALLPAFLAPAAAPQEEEPPELAFLRREWAQMEAERARGLLPPDAAEALQLELSRRLLAAARAGGGGAAAAGGAWPLRLGVAGIALLLAFSFSLYHRLGSPGLPDLPIALRKALAEDLRQNRPSQAAAEAAQGPWQDPEMDAETAALITKLRRVAAERPGDAEGQAFLLQYESALGNFRGAAEAQARILAIKGESAGPQDWLIAADLMIRAAGGYVAPEAEALLEKVLKAEPQNPLARYYVGLMLAQTGRPDLGFALWQALWPETKAGDAWAEPLAAQIGPLAAAAGARFTPEGGPLKGPDAAAVEAAGALSAEERQAQIVSMVEGLDARLKAEGGSPAEWAQLLRAYAVLGDAAALARVKAAALAAYPGEAALFDDAARAP